MTMNENEKRPLLDQPQNASEAEAQEPSLAELQRNVFRAQREYMKAWSRTTSGKWHKRIMFGVTALLLLFAAFCVAVIIQDSLDDDIPSTYTGKVPLEVHIMSKCPDARDCLHDMILPAMQNVSHKVDFKLSYIGNVTDHDDGVLCMHGEGECLGNIIELCAAKQYPDPKIYLGFTMCMARDFEEIPEKQLVQDCALEHGISMEKLNDCTVNEDGALSVDMLKESFNRSATAGVSKSCTVRLNNKIRCIRDGGEWKDCDGGSSAKDLVADINAESKKLWQGYAG
ncbi:hypothetical protein D0867_01583 [Hortaea werneckii]|uniref:Gamma interferon inducible lysosomal thiol reductase GILT n=1 Tax=Hortaea werneckii TaxID=91943 RepID=A0A3M7A9R5_HORWE|nr:hypothetical protein D0867_01583 [Hortaea werneckii]